MQSENFSSEQPETAIPMAEPRTSGMAIASLVLGIVGFCVPCISALVGLILGIVALVSINKSNGRLKGTGLAVSGIVVSAITMLIVPVMLAILMPALAKVKTLSYQMLCGTNLKGIANAMAVYADDNKGRFPTGSKWCDLLITNTGVQRQLFVCKASGSTDSSYAMNKNAEAAGKDAPPDMVIVFESRPGWNQCGGPELLSTDNHEIGCNVLFVDGHIEFVKKENIGSLRWKPDNSAQQPPMFSISRIQPLLALRIVPTVEGKKPPVISTDDFARYSQDLAANGPDAATAQGRDYAWFKVRNEQPYIGLQGLPAAKYQNRMYILLCTSAKYSMSTSDAGNGMWKVERAFKSTDRDGRPGVGFMVDGTGSVLFNKLTSNNPRNRLAIAVGGEVRSVATIESALWNQGIITGDFTEDEIKDMVDMLSSGRPPTN
jgi:prepilin-type processing-associated H-X9-DG protein